MIWIFVRRDYGALECANVAGRSVLLKERSRYGMIVSGTKRTFTFYNNRSASIGPCSKRVSSSARCPRLQQHHCRFSAKFQRGSAKLAHFGAMQHVEQTHVDMGGEILCGL
jgi:hypothetical protein